MTKSIAELAEGIASLVTEKEKAYGSAFDKAGEFIKLLYPEGIKPDQYKDMLCVLRIFDKLMRIATAYDGTEEKRVEAYSDTTGYSLLGLRAALAEVNAAAPSKTEQKESVPPTAAPPTPAVQPDSPHLGDKAQVAKWKHLVDQTGTTQENARLRPHGVQMSRLYLYTIKNSKDPEIVAIAEANLAEVLAMQPENVPVPAHDSSRWASMAFLPKKPALPGVELTVALKPQTVEPEVNTRLTELAFNAPLSNRPRGEMWKHENEQRVQTFREEETMRKKIAASSADIGDGISTLGRHDQVAPTPPFTRRKPQAK